MALMTGIECYMGVTFLFGECKNMFQQCASMTLAPCFRKGREVIDIKMFVPFPKDICFQYNFKLYTLIN